MTNEMTLQAESLAREIMAGMRVDGEPRRALDTAYGDVCWVAIESPAYAVVVYDDEPDTQVSTGNHRGRFATLATV